MFHKNSWNYSIRIVPTIPYNIEMIPTISSHKTSISPKTSHSTHTQPLSNFLFQDTLTEYRFKHNSSIYTLLMFKTSTVSETKKRLQEKLNTTNDITLKYRKTLLKDGNILLDYNISPEDSINITILKPTKLQIFIKGPKLTLIRAYKSSTVAELKQIMLKKTHWPNQNFYLSFRGKIIEDKNTLKYYEITHNSTLEYIERIQGGSLQVSSFPFCTTNTEIERRFYKESPLGRSINHGFIIKGRCNNTKCVAFNDVIYINKGYGRFDLARECFTARCMQCLQVFKTLLNYCFLFASYEWIGCLKSGEKKEGKGIAGLEKYETFQEGEYLDWAYLEVNVKAFP